MTSKRLAFLLGIASLLVIGGGKLAAALPPPEDIPEEMLRMEVMTDGRSPLNGAPLTAEEYAEVRSQLEQPGFAPALSPQLRHLIFLLEVRRLLNSVSPVPLF